MYIHRYVHNCILSNDFFLVHTQVKETPSSDHPVEKTSVDKGIAAHGPQKRDPTPSEEFVLVYLLENNKLLSAAENQLGRGAQVSFVLLQNNQILGHFVKFCLF